MYTLFFNSVILMVIRARIPTAEKLKALRSQTQLNMSHQIEIIMAVILIWPAVNKRNIVLIMKSTKQNCLIKEMITEKVSWKNNPAPKWYEILKNTFEYYHFYFRRRLFIIVWRLDRIGKHKQRHVSIILRLNTLNWILKQRFRNQISNPSKNDSNLYS